VVKTRRRKVTTSRTDIVAAKASCNLGYQEPLKGEEGPAESEIGMAVFAREILSDSLPYDHILKYDHKEKGNQNRKTATHADREGEES